MADDIPAEDKLEDADAVARQYDLGDEHINQPTPDLSDGDEKVETFDLDEVKDDLDADAEDDHKHPDGQLDGSDDEKAAY
jgi:hypothetical protein